MLFSLLYMVLRGVLRLAPAGDERDREVGVLVLRHQVKVLKRKTCRPKLSRLDRLFLAAGSRVLPKERWSSFVVTPTTLRGRKVPHRERDRGIDPAHADSSHRGSRACDLRAAPEGCT